ncbi:MAG: hypothetical protein M3R48_04900 [Candidatus Dormibacteraeota bacterium]|nr:hypothetical protein [Candidatus Dormibacteraeota bacterium]
MTEISTIRKSSTDYPMPTGVDSLRVRERYLHRRSLRRRLGDRGLMATWVGMGALVSWLLVVGFTALH